jgi:drug/metabolite transporter (DMT)-like permease
MPSFSIIKRSPFAGPLFMLLSACFFTAMNVLLKQAMTEFRVWDIGFYRFFGGLVLLTAFFGRRSNPFRSSATKLLIVRGCTGSIAFIFFILSVRLLPVSTALMLLYAFPAFAALFSAALYREKVSPVGWACLVAVLIGVALLVDPRSGGETLGYAAGICSAIFAGLTMAIIRRLKQTNGSVIIYLYFCLVGSVVTAPFFLRAPILPLSFSQILVCSGIILTSIAGQLLMNHGFGYCRSWEGGLYMTTEVLLTSLAGILLFMDPVGWNFFCGGTLILGSTLAIQAEKAIRSRGLAAHQPGRLGDEPKNNGQNPL